MGNGKFAFLLVLVIVLAGGSAYYAYMETGKLQGELTDLQSKFDQAQASVTAMTGAASQAKTAADAATAAAAAASAAAAKAMDTANQAATEASAATAAVAAKAEEKPAGKKH